MAGVHFTGPILFAGKNNEKKWFENLPIDKNPDYVVYFDDFDRIGFDSNTGHRWTVVKDSGASVAIAADQLNGLVNLNSTATTDTDAFFIMTDAPNGMKMFVRSPIKTAIEGDFDTGNVRFKARERYSFGFSDPRGIFGSPGAA